MTFEFVEPLAAGSGYLMLRSLVSNGGCCWETVKVDPRGFSKTDIAGICIPHTVEILEDECFAEAKLRFLAFETYSNLSLVKKSAFASFFRQALKSCSHLTTFFHEEDLYLDELSDSMFEDCASLEFICIPGSVERMGAKCFFRCKSLRIGEFEASSALRVLESEAFAECSSLSCISFPASVEAIGQRCFSECVSLMRAEFEGDPALSRIESEAFFKCSALKAFPMPSSAVGLSVVGQRCFAECESLLAVDFETGATCTSFESGVCLKCSSLVSITIPRLVDHLPAQCFMECAALRQVKFEPNSSITRICAEAFAKCSTLEWIVVPASVKTLCVRCFFDCIFLGVVDFELDSKLRRIESGAFQNCTSLVSMRRPNSVDEVCYDSFLGCPVASAWTV
jgi:hypothetical protein